MHEIRSFEELVHRLELLHDCPFDLERSSFNESLGSWTGIFLRPLWDDPHAERWGIPFVYDRTKLPVAEVSLTVFDVGGVAIVDDQQIGQYSFDDVQSAEGGFTMRFNERMRIELRVCGSIKATYEERLLQGTLAVYHQFFFVQKGPTLEAIPKPL